MGVFRCDRSVVFYAAGMVIILIYYHFCDMLCQAQLGGYTSFLLRHSCYHSQSAGDSTKVDCMCFTLLMLPERSTLILHLGFFGRIISLYRRNFQRVECLTAHAQDLADSQIDAWWNCRSFVLNEDLALDYDIGGLAVSATFLVNISVFMVLLVQVYREGFSTMLEPPGSYCAYACLYLTMCLIRIFTLATSTFEEQQR